VYAIWTYIIIIIIIWLLTRHINKSEFIKLNWIIIIINDSSTQLVKLCAVSLLQDIHMCPI
jgi:hypothetical protein